MRKPIQVISCEAFEVPGKFCPDERAKFSPAVVIALCDDGSIWAASCRPEAKDEWKRLKDIPQDAEEKYSVPQEALL